MTESFGPTSPPSGPTPSMGALPAAPARSARGRLTWLWVLGIVIAFGGGLVIGLAIDKDQGRQSPLAGKANHPLVAGATTSTTPEPATTYETTTTETPEPPSVGDFTVSVTLLSKQCFGTAGCNITYRIKPSYSGPTLSADQTYTVTYQVSGVEDGPQVNSFTLTGDQAEFESEESAQTASSHVKLSVKVTSVSEG